jgi:hypothetical protein
MPVSRSAEIQLRRDRVLELHSKGLTQSEIAVKLNYAQQTISKDIAYLKQKSMENLRLHYQELPYQREQALSNLYSIRKEAWALLEQIKDDRLKANLYVILKDINEAILDVLAAGDLIAQEVVNAQLIADEAKEDLQKILNEEPAVAKF